MKRASYREAVAFAADLDSDVTKPEDMEGLVTVCLIAQIFDVPNMQVVADVERARKKAAV